MRWNFVVGRNRRETIECVFRLRLPNRRVNACETESELPSLRFHTAAGVCTSNVLGNYGANRFETQLPHAGKIRLTLAKSPTTSSVIIPSLPGEPQALSSTII